MAPEIIQRGEIDSKVDIFSFGVSLFIMLFARYPFQRAAITDKEYRWLILGKRKQFIENFQKKNSDLEIDESLMDLFCDLWAANPHNRPSISEIKQKNWMKEA